MLIYTLWVQRDILMAEQQYFVKMLVVNIVLFVLDTFTYVLNYHNIWYLAVINKVCCAVFCTSWIFCLFMDNILHKGTISGI